MINSHILRSKLPSGFLLALAFFVGACDRTTPIISSGTGGGSNAKTDVQLSAFSKFPDIPLPSDAEINVDKTLIFGSKPWYGQLSLSSSSNAASVFDFFRAHLPNYDWEELTSVRAPVSILTYDNEDRVLTIAIESGRLVGSQVTLTASPKGEPAPALQGSTPPAPITQTQIK